MIRKRNLDPSLIQWIMTVTGLGPGIGEIFWVAPAESATSNYREYLADQGVTDLYTLPSLAYAATTQYRNDVILVSPGAYNETASTAWSNDNTHLIGLGGPNIGGDHSEPNVAWYTDTTSVADVVDITGNNCMFVNVNILNAGAHAANVAAVNLDAYGCYFKNVGIKGCMTTEQNGVAAGSSLNLAGGAMYPIFENCQIGQDVWGTRTTANQGVIRYTGTARPNGGDFYRCRILSVGDDVTCSMVAMPASTSSGRGWRFDNCHFYHFASTGGGDKNLNQAFYTVTGSQKDIVTLHHCVAAGIDAWADGAHETILSDMAVPAVTGGLGIEPT